MIKLDPYLKGPLPKNDAVVSSLEFTFDENEARDDHGRWSVSERVAEEGGMTYDPHTGSEPTDGFIVAKEGIPSTFVPTDAFLNDDAAAHAALDRFLLEHAAEYDDPAAMVGIWHDTDPKHDEIVLDVTEKFDTQDEAVKAGVDRNQQSIWDVVGKQEIKTGGTGR